MDVNLLGDKDAGLVKLAKLVAKHGHTAHLAGAVVEGGLAVFCVSAVDGPTEATFRRWNDAVGCRLAPAAIVLTKADLVDDEDLLELVEVEVRDALTGTIGDERAEAIPRIVFPGEKVGKQLRKALEAPAKPVEFGPPTR